jgi:hypothetical protein
MVELVVLSWIELIVVNVEEAREGSRSKPGELSGEPSCLMPFALTFHCLDAKCCAADVGGRRQRCHFHEVL